MLDSPGRPLKDDRYQGNLPLFDEDIKVPGSEGTLDQCRQDFRSLLIEISSLYVHDGPVSEMDPDDSFRILFHALQGWQVFIAAVFRSTVETDLDNLATTHPNLATSRQLNRSLVHLLEHVWDMARNEMFGVGPAMLFVIVRAPRPHQVRSVPDSLFLHRTPSLRISSHYRYSGSPLVIHVRCEFWLSKLATGLLARCCSSFLPLMTWSCDSLR